jgi:hydrogenase nickel incorporation protein HypA/HybF
MVRRQGAGVHEYSIVRALVDRVEAAAVARGATAVRSIAVRIGELAGVDVELLATAYRTLAAGTLCERSALEVSTVAARWACRDCGAAIAAGGPLRCAACDGPAALQQGDEILLERMEIDVDDDGKDTTDVRHARL